MRPAPKTWSHRRPVWWHERTKATWKGVELASNRTSCRSPLPHQIRLTLPTVAFCVRQFEVMMIAMLIVRPLVLFLRKCRARPCDKGV
jgi:hypothetical protein